MRNGGWIQTFSGLQYWPLEPRAQDVRIEDIAHHLGMLCRFTGACTRFYSVAEHSVHVSAVIEATGADRGVVLRALMHDAAEAYCNDIARPVKRAIVGYGEIEARNWDAICDALGMDELDDDADALIKQADNAMLLAEQKAIMAPCAHSWTPQDVPDAMLRTAHDRMRLANIHGIAGAGSPIKSGRAFLHRYRELTTP